MTVREVDIFGPTKKNGRRTVSAGSYGVVAVVRVEGGARRDAEVEGRDACVRKFTETWGPLGTWEGVTLTHTHLTAQLVTELRIEPF